MLAQVADRMKKPSDSLKVKIPNEIGKRGLKLIQVIIHNSHTHPMPEGQSQPKKIRQKR